LTHAVTIQRRPDDVWPWLVQMGAGRAGWYSYDWIDNGRQPSASCLVPGLQAAATIGSLFPALPGTTDAFHALAVETHRHLVLGVRGTGGRGPLVTWAFVLEPAGPDATRLIARARGAAGYPFYGLPVWLGLPAIRAGHFIMQRKQLLGIAARAESSPSLR
jgi:hypothetical protein